MDLPYRNNALGFYKLLHHTFCHEQEKFCFLSYGIAKDCTAVTKVFSHADSVRVILRLYYTIFPLLVEFLVASRVHSYFTEINLH